jgi:signal transduction histidine kinase
MKARASYRSLWLRFATLLGLAATYFVAGKLGLRRAFVHRSATAVWMPSGISLAALILFGYRSWPAIFAGAFLVNFTTEGSIATCLGIASGNTLEALAGAWLVKRFAGGRDAFLHPHNIFKFALLAGISTMIAATLGTTSLFVTGYAEGARPGQVWLTWWLGDAMGDLLITPVILLWASDRTVAWNRRKTMEAMLLLLLLVLAGMAVFGEWNAFRDKNYPLGFVFIPILMWPPFRFQPRETATASLIFTGFAVRGTLNGFGPFARVLPNESLLLLQAYAGVTTITAICVAAAVRERTQAISQLRHSEQRLARTNADLERFAFATSHDLKEPLRAVSTFTELIAKRHRGQLGPETDHLISRIVSGAQRMTTVIEGMCTYAEIVGTGKISSKPVVLEQVVEWAKNNLDVLIRESNAQVVYEPLPVVRGDPEQLGRVFQNLIANSIKYRSEAVPLIHISVDRNDRDWTISVHDNGIGIEPEYREVVFELFKRLHGSDLSGTGIGLSISKRIVELHGGRIWVESENGKGAIFRFTLPA